MEFQGKCGNTGERNWRNGYRGIAIGYGKERGGRRGGGRE